MARISREQMEKESRPARVPVSEANRNKLLVKGLDKDNYVYRWVNDVEDRLSIFLQGSWEFVDQNGNAVGDGGVDNSAGTSSKFTKGVGRGVTAYLMRIPKDLWLDDQAAKEAEIKEREVGMKQTIKSAGDYGKVEIT